MRTLYLVLLAVILLGLPVAAQVPRDSVTRLIHDQSAPRQPFSGSEVSGHILYREAYQSGAAQPLVVGIRLRMPAKLYCMDAADFSYDLRNANGQQIQPAMLPGSGEAPPTIFITPHDHVCPYDARNDGTFLLHLDKIFPDLQRGRYTLQMTFRPRDGSVAPTPLPPIRFSVV